MNDTDTLSIKEARVIMGEEANNLTDEEMQKLIDQLNSLSRTFVQAVLKENVLAVFMEYNRGKYSRCDSK